MTPAARERALVDWVLEREGSAFSNDPDDMGSATRWGITAAAAGEWLGLGGPASAEVVARLTEGEARAFYSAKYVRHPALRLDLVEPIAAALVIIDGAVLFGRGRAARWAQEATGGLSRLDGVLGPVSRAALAATPPARLVGRVQRSRLRRHVEVVRENPRQMKWLGGWCDRTGRLAEALEIAA